MQFFKGERVLHGLRMDPINLRAALQYRVCVIYRREVVTHKTFHRYTVRAKRGTAQGLQDAQGRASRSAGASLRRYNEAML